MEGCGTSSSRCPAPPPPRARSRPRPRSAAAPCPSLEPFISGFRVFLGSVLKGFSEIDRGFEGFCMMKPLASIIGGTGLRDVVALHNFRALQSATLVRPLALHAPAVQPEEKHHHRDPQTDGSVGSHGLNLRLRVQTRVVRVCWGRQIGELRCSIIIVQSVAAATVLLSSC